MSAPKRNRVTHIPDNGFTYCGRLTSHVITIDKLRDCIEDATCKACQRSDDRRVREEIVAEFRSKERT